MRDDLISRQAAIDALHMHLMYRMGTDSNKKRLDEWINNLPSAQPERPKGEWILHSYMPHNNYCSNCEKDSPYNRRWNFCPNCGADIRGEQNE